MNGGSALVCVILQVLLVLNSFSFVISIANTLTSVGFMEEPQKKKFHLLPNVIIPKRSHKEINDILQTIS